MAKNIKKMVVFIIGFCSMINAYADNLGVVGHVYPIEETDFLEFIDARLRTMQQDGTLDKVQKGWESEVKQAIIRPKPLALSTTDKPRVYHYNPTFIANHDIFNTSGQVVVHKGDRANPLTLFPLFNKTMIFFNDDDTAQRAWAKAIISDRATSSPHETIKPILTQGNVKEAARSLGVPVYFDQYGKITHKLGIEHVPCMVTRKGDVLEVREYAIKEYDGE